MQQNRIAELRHIDGLNQKELGEKLGVGQTTISAWERGQNEPDSKSLHRMSKIFSASIGYIMGYEAESYKRGLSNEEFENLRLERELEKRETNTNKEDELIDEIERRDLLEEWDKATKPGTLEGYKVSKLIDKMPSKDRKKLLAHIEYVSSLIR